LASELRERIRNSGVEIRVVDRTARAEYKVEPREFEGRLLHEVERDVPRGSELYVELYLNKPQPSNTVGLYRSGTRVLDNIALLDVFQRPPWTTGYLQGIVDAQYLNLTPGTRTGLIQDEAFVRFASELSQVERNLLAIIEAQQRAEEERASRDVLRSVQKALKEALLALPAEEYDWFNVREAEGQRPRPQSKSGNSNRTHAETESPSATESPSLRNDDSSRAEDSANRDLAFFDCPGPLFSVRIAPASSVLPVTGSRTFRAVSRDRAGRLVQATLAHDWTIVEGEGQLGDPAGEIVTFHAPGEPGLTRLRVEVIQGETRCEAEALVTVTESLIPQAKPPGAAKQGIPGYTYQKAPGELWRSRYDPDQNVVVINNGHRDFVFASRSKALKLRYIIRLFSKELVLRNFAGLAPHQLLERLIELTLRAEENLK
jgi:hypothetical protein